jgi:Transglutaminase-like superfamily
VKRLVLESWLLLIRFEWIMCLGKFDALCRVVHQGPVRSAPAAPLIDKEDLCRAMDYACVFYFKRVHCLQRSAATALLLRRHGLDVELVIGAKLLPFRSHAWVEFNGHVINDKPYMRTIYQVLDRC